MTQTHYNGNFEVIRMTGDLDGVEASAAITVGSLPANFRVLAGFVDCAQGTTNNEISVGYTGTAAGFLSDDSIASAALSGVSFEAGLGYRNTSAIDVLVTNSGSAAIPSTATAVTVTFVGQREYE